MYDGNLNIDNPNNKWTKEEVEKLFIFCQFDRAMPYEKVCDAFNYLGSRDMLSFGAIGKLTSDELRKLLKKAGLRFWSQTAKYLEQNVMRFDGNSLKEMSRDELAKKCMGFGYKLASMFHNRIHGTQYAIIDVHIDRFLVQHGCKAAGYKAKEKCFADIAKSMGKTTEELDWEVWNTNRIGARNGRNGNV